MEKNFFLYVFSLFFVCVGLSPVTYAAETNFSVSPVLPENQIDKSKSYFTLLMAQGEEQDIHITLTNNSSESLTIEAEIGPATTNDNGFAEYANKSTNLDSTLKYNLSELAKYSKEITIDSNASIDYIVHLKMPNEKLSGLIAGGVTFKQKKDEQGSESINSDNGIALENKIEYLEAILIQQSVDSLKPDMILSNVKASQINSRNVIQANLKNPVATYINDIESTVNVYKRGEDEILFSQQTKGQQMAPNSNFNYTLYLDDNTPFKAGNYTWEQVLKSEKNEWKFSRNFSINKDEADQLNKSDVTVEDEKPNYLLIGLGVLCSLLIIILLILLLKNREMKKRKGENKSKRKKMKRK